MLYLFGFQKRKEPKVINENNKKNAVLSQTFSPDTCSGWSGVTPVWQKWVSDLFWILE